MSNSPDIGTKVVCIDDDFPAWARATYNHLPSKDTVYTIRHIDQGLDAQEVVKHGSDKDTFKGSSPLKFTGVRTIMILLEEFTNPVHEDTKKEMGFKLERFAPLLDTTTKAKAVATVKAPKTPSKAPVRPSRKKKEVLEPVTV